MIQRIPDIRGELCTVLWDTGTQISKVTYQYAGDAGFKGHPASIRISGVGAGNKNKSRVQYRVLLRKRDGGVAEFTPQEHPHHSASFGSATMHQIQIQL
jgi:hypothetical protein